MLIYRQTEREIDSCTQSAKLDVATRCLIRLIEDTVFTKWARFRSTLHDSVHCQVLLSVVIRFEQGVIPLPPVGWWYNKTLVSLQYMMLLNCRAICAQGMGPSRWVREAAVLRSAFRFPFCLSLSPWAQSPQTHQPWPKHFPVVAIQSRFGVVIALPVWCSSRWALEPQGELTEHDQFEPQIVVWIVPRHMNVGHSCRVLHNSAMIIILTSQRLVDNTCGPRALWRIITPQHVSLPRTSEHSRLHSDPRVGRNIHVHGRGHTRAKEAS